MAAFCCCAVILIAFGNLLLAGLRCYRPDLAKWSQEWFISCISWAAAFLTIITSALAAIGVAHKVITLPMVLGMLPTAFVATYLLVTTNPTVEYTAAASVGGVLTQAVLLACLMRHKWTLKQVTWPATRGLMKSIPIAAVGALCFSGYAAVDAVLGSALGDSVLSHQALGQRLVIAFGSVLSAGPFLLAPTKLGALVATRQWAAIIQYIERSSLTMVALTTVSYFLMPSVGALIIRYMFQHGTFSAADTQAVAAVVQVLLLGAGPMLATAIVFRALHAVHHRSHVAAISVIWFTAYILLSVCLMDSLSSMSLAVSYTISWAITFTGALIYIKSALGKNIEGDSNEGPTPLPII